MSLHPQEIPPVPEETRRVAQAAFPRGNLYMRIRDTLGAIDDAQLFAPLYHCAMSIRHSLRAQQTGPRCVSASWPGPLGGGSLPRGGPPPRALRPPPRPLALAPRARGARWDGARGDRAASTATR